MNIGYCRFCGASRMLPEEAGSRTEEELNEAATRLCDCEKGKWYAQSLRIMEVYEQDLHLLLGEGREEIKAVLLPAGSLILEGKIGGISMSLPGDASIKVRYKKNGLATSLVRRNTQETLSCG